MKVTIALFAYGGISSECLLCHMDLLAGIIKGNLPVKMFTIREDALISRSRCRATGQFLRDPDHSDVLIMLDHDIEFKAADIFALAQLAHTQQAVVGIPYAKRKFGAGSAGRPHIVPPVSQPTLAQVQYLGAGCIAVPRGTIETTVAHCKGLQAPLGVSWCEDSISPFWTLWHPFVLDSEYLSEDYAFCERARAAGVPILAWLGPKLTHWGVYGFKLMEPELAQIVTTAIDLGLSGNPLEPNFAPPSIFTP
jgi:hypothetical protein